MNWSSLATVPSSWQNAIGTFSCRSLSPSFSTTSGLTTHLVQPNFSKVNTFPWAPNDGMFNDWDVDGVHRTTYQGILGISVIPL